jgi:hypothetical protein
MRAVSHHVQEINFALQSIWPPSHVSAAAFFSRGQPWQCTGHYYESAIGTGMILRRPEERNKTCLYTTESWRLGEKKIVVSVASVSFRKSDATLPVALLSKEH